MRKAVFLLFLLMIGGCAAIDKTKAEGVAAEFVNKNVRFFAKQENSTLGLPQYSIDSITSAYKDKEWIVVMHISSKVGNETKKNDLAVKLNSKGNVVEFNGQKVGK